MAASSIKRGKALILHVEDDKPQLDCLKGVLEGSGFAILQANTAAEALQLTRDTPISLVLADHMLGGSSGAELAGQIKVLKPTVPVVLHSGTPPPTMRHIDGFINKGEPTGTLVNFLRELVERFWE